MSTSQTLKLELMEWLATLHDTGLIEELAKWKEDHQRVSIEQYNEELDEANARIEEGDFISHEDLKKESATWLK